MRGLFLVGLIFGGGLSMEGNLRFKIDWTTLIVGRKFTVFALFCFVFEDNSRYKPPGGVYLEGRSNGRFWLNELGGLIFGGTYIWRGLFSDSTVLGLFANQRGSPVAALQVILLHHEVVSLQSICRFAASRN